MERIEILKTFFKGRKSAYVVMKPAKNSVFKKTVKEELTDEVLEKHLRGEIRVSVYLIDEEGRVWWGGYDVDSLDEDHKKAGLILYQRIWDLQGEALIYTTGGRGFRVVTFFDGVPSELAYAFLRHIYETSQKEFPPGVKVEIFPKQPRLTKGTQFGSALSLPFGLHPDTLRPSEFVDDKFEPVEDPESIFDALNPMTEAHLKALDIPPPMPRPVHPLPAFDLKGRAAPCLEELVKKGIPQQHRNSCLFIFGCHLIVLGLPVKLAIELVHYMNYSRCSPPLPEAEVKNIAKQIAKRRYRKRGCDDPLWSELYCSEEAKKNCSFYRAISFPLRIVEWQRSRPSRYKLEVRLPDGTEYTLRRRFTVSALLNKAEMERAVLDETGFCFADLGLEAKGEEYKQLIASRIREAEKVEMGEEAEEEARIRDIILRHLRDQLSAEAFATNIETFRSGLIVAKDDIILFHLPPLHEYLRRFKAITRPDLVSLLREMGAYPTREYVFTERVRCWAIPKAKIGKIS